LKYLRLFVDLLSIKRRNWKAVVLAVFAATVFWFFNALNKEYTANIEFPVVFEYDASAFAPAAELPGKIKVSVSGVGWNLFRKSSGVRVTPLSIAIEEPGTSQKIPGSALQPVIAAQLTELKVNYVLQDTLQLFVDAREMKTVRLAPARLNDALRDGFGIAGEVVITPDSVVLSGPRSLLLKIPDTILLEIPARRVGSDYTEDLPVPVPRDEFVVRDPPVVSVSFPVGRTQVGRFRVPLFLEGNRKGFRYDAPDSISISAIGTDWCRALVLNGLSRATLRVDSLERGSFRLAPLISNLPACTLSALPDSVSLLVR
jgi:hypothetical protein